MAVPALAPDARAVTAGRRRRAWLLRGLGRDQVTAADLLIAPDEMPNRGFGGVTGVHFYPFARAIGRAWAWRRDDLRAGQGRHGI